MVKNRKFGIKVIYYFIFFNLISINLFFSTPASQNYTNEIIDEEYYTYNHLSLLLYQLKILHPDIFNYYSLGKTYEGRDIWLVKISDNVEINEDEPEILYTGGMHGDEKQGYQVVIYSLIAIVENYTKQNVNYSFTERIKNIVNNVQLYFIPMVNPDGCVAGTRKNRRPNNCILGSNLLSGVDINRNSGYKWELLDEHPLLYRRSGLPYIIERTNIKYPISDFYSIVGEGCYRGPHPFSEPESKAIKQVAENHSFLLSVDYHSYASKILTAWGWTKEPPPDEALIISIAQNISNINGLIIQRCGEYVEILGRINDWLYAEHGIISFGIELPPTYADGYLLPWKNEPILKICKVHLLVNLYLAERANSI